MNPLLQHEQSLIRGNFTSLFGGFAQQNPSVMVSFNRLLNAHSFDTIIEIGTHTAGLSLLFALYAHLSRTPAICANSNEPSLFVNQTHHRRPKVFHTYDYVVRDESVVNTLHLLGARFHREDTLTDQSVIDSIRSLISNPRSGSVLLLCDGGNKKKELELYGESLKRGDFVMLHDWAYDEAAFDRNRREGIWFSWESRWADGTGEGQQFGIKDLCEQYGIQPVYAEEFDKVAWFCGRK